MPQGKKRSRINVSDEATRADMVVALRKLEEEIAERKRKEQELSAAYGRLSAVEEDLRAQYGSLVEREKALRESEERWQFALEGAGDGIWDWDAQTNRVVFSRQWKAMLGYEEGDIGDTLEEWEKRIHPDDKAAVFAEIQKHFDGEIPVYTSEHRVLCKDGTYKWILDRGKVISRTPDGKAKRVIGTHADISERKNNEEERRAREALLDNVLESTADGILVIGPCGEVLTANRRFQELWRIPAALVGEGNDKQLLDYVLDQLSDPQGFLAEVQRLYQTKEEGWSSLEFKDGRIYERYSRPLQLDAGLGRLWSFRDITERRRAEEALRRSEDKFAKAFHSSPDALVIARADDGKIVEVNEGFSALTGYAREEALGRTTLSLNLWVNPQEREGYIAALSKHSRVRDTEYDFRAKNGSILHCVVSAEMIRLGNEPYALSIVRDITERKRAERERLEIERRLLHSQKLESLGVLAGGIAHDFNNLLMAIIGNLDLALLDLSPVSPSREYLEQAMHASRRASDLTRQMLAYSGKGRFVLEGIDLAELVLENAHLLKASITKTASLNLVVTPGLSLIQADPGQVQQVIMNLITNASEAIADKAGVITITTGEQEFSETYLNQSRVENKPSPGRFVYVEVSDTGCGMDKDTLRRLFEPFFTTKFTGRGLGMAAVLGIVRGHRGAILVESEKGRGSTIRVLFPVTGSTGGNKDADFSMAVKPASAGLFSGTALIVDDEDAVRNLCAAYVGRLGLKTLLAADGKQALELFSKHAGEIVCVVLDLNMPQMDGVSTFRELKRLQPDIQVILCSGYNEQEATQHFYGEGLAAFIQKPYRLQDLKQKIEQVLRSRSQIQPEAGTST